MITKLTGTALTLGLLAMSTAAFASPAKPAGINAREQRQEQRIKNGVADDQLTKAEVDRLRAAEAAIRAEERVYRDSGKGLDSAEYKALENQLDKTSREIYRLAHNDRTRGGGQ